MDDDPLAALMDEMATAQRGGEAEAASGGGPSAATRATLEEEEPPSKEERSIWRPDVQPSGDLMGFARTPPPPASSAGAADPGLELQRQKLMGTLTVLFLNRARTLGIDVRMPTLERWVISQNQTHAGGTSTKDPVLPSGGGSTESSSSSSSHEARAGASLLFRELREAGASKAEAGKLCTRLVQAAGKAVRQLGARGGTSSGGGSSKGVTVVREEGAGGAYTVRFKSTTHTINAPHYHKLARLFNRHGPSSPSGSSSGRRHHHHHRHGGGGGGGSSEFRRYLFCLLSRYSALAGGTDRGGGMQGALNEDCFEVLLKYFDCRFECFASPFNCRYGRYCSAFPDLDMAFGSLGSFFDFRPTQGCYEANPPFVPCVIQRMARHMEDLLTQSQEEEEEEGGGGALCFIVVIPAWSEDKNQRVVQAASGRPWKRLRNSAFCVRHVLCRAEQHGYCEGGQHQRPTRYKTSRFDTSVFFLQNQRARDKWPVTDKACEELLSAFSSKHEEETRRRRREGGAGQQQPKGKGVGLGGTTYHGIHDDDDDDDGEAILKAINGGEASGMSQSLDDDDEEEDEDGAGGGDYEEEQEEEEEEGIGTGASGVVVGGGKAKEKRRREQQQQQEGEGGEEGTHTKKRKKHEERGGGGAKVVTLKKKLPSSDSSSSSSKKGKRKHGKSR